MNFFERQRAARGTTVKLVLLFALAVLSLVVALDAIVFVVATGQSYDTGSTVRVLILATAFTLLIVSGGTLYKTLALRSGGAAVALSVGAVAVDPTSTDPQLRRLVNIVEEMSIASGVPAPRIFVLGGEQGINAFAAGYTASDAAITVTAGALQRLNRDELQAVVGHEFSHILNGDMRLNIKLIGLLHGILLIGLIGLRILQGAGSVRTRKSDGVAAGLLIGLALVIFGFLGRFFAGLIQAAVSRQREWLADASAVQFTRDPMALAGALKKIAGLPTGSALADTAAASQLNHMLFGEGKRSLSGLYATHPPLLERIKALDPSFDPGELENLTQRWAAQPPEGLSEDASLGLVGPQAATVAGSSAAAAPVTAAPASAAGPSPRTPIPTASVPVPLRHTDVAAQVGTLTAAAVVRGAELSARIPAQVRQLAAQPSTAEILVLALAMTDDPRWRAAQHADVAAVLGPAAADAAARTAADLDRLPTELRLPVLSLAVPQLAMRPAAVRAAVVGALERMVHRDGAISLFEYCLTRTVVGCLRDAEDPSRRARVGRAEARSVAPAVFTLLAAVAAAGNVGPAADAAFRAALGHVLPGAQVDFRPESGHSWAALDAGWEMLDGLDPAHKQRLIEALVIAVEDDGVLTLHEAELLRTACLLLHCPLPSFVA